MYTIIGGDGKEYGPVPAEQVREWIAAGRANLDTQAKAAGTNEWKRLRDHPDFGAESPDAPPVMPGGPASLENELASPWLRLGARLLDGVLAAVLVGPGFLMMLPWLIAQSNADASHGLFPRSPFSAFSGDIPLAGIPTSAAAVLAAGWVVLMAIQIALLSTRGQSVGKIVAGVRIVRLDGQPAGFVHAWLLRACVVGFICAIPFVGSFFAVLDILFIFTASRRCLHDRIAGTHVVKAA